VVIREEFVTGGTGSQGGTKDTLRRRTAEFSKSEKTF